MRTILELIHEANRIVVDEVTGQCTADGILAALAALEAAKARRAKRTADDYQPADPDAVALHVAEVAEDVVSASAVYRDIYGRVGTTAELRTAADALRAAGWVPYKSNGRTLWRRKTIATDGIFGLANGPEIVAKTREWAESREWFRETAANIFRLVFERNPTSTEARAVGQTLRDIGVLPRRSNGALIYEKRG
jgi:hypothetical protein